MLPEFSESNAHASVGVCTVHRTFSPARRARKLFLQRERRYRLRRIDYYSSESAAALINSLRVPRTGGDASSIINRIIAEWAAARSEER